MFILQKFILDKIPELKLLKEKYQRPVDVLDSITMEATDFVVRVPLIGAFSSGKSSLLNALIGEKLFAVEVDPETTVPAEVRYAAQESYIGLYANGSAHPVDRTDIESNSLPGLHNGGLLQVSLPSENLALFPHLCLADLPGLESGIDAHAKAIDGYINRSLAYCIVVSVDEGTLHESTRKFLLELRVHQMPVIVVITKSDKKPENQVQDVAATIGGEVEKILEGASFEVVTVSARKKKIDGFMRVLCDLESRSEVLFTQSVGEKIRLDLKTFDQYLNVIANRDDLGTEKISLERERVQQEMNAFGEKFVAETLHLESRVGPVLARITRALESRLKDQLDHLANRALDGNDISRPIEQLVRLSVSESIKEEFEPELRRYFSSLENDLPTDIGLDFTQYSKHAPRDTPIGIDALKASIMALAVKLLSKHPIGLLLLPVITPLFDKLFRSTGNKQADESERREGVRQQILSSMIPKVVSQVEQNVRTMLAERVAQAKIHIAAAVAVQRESLESAMKDLDTKLRLGKEAYEAARQQCIADQVAVRQIITTLEAP